MSFKEAISIEKIKEITDEIYAHVESIVEYGYVTIASDEYSKLKERSEKLQKLLKECEKELNSFCDEMTDWYSY